MFHNGWCPVPQIDRSMSRAEYRKERKEARRYRRYGQHYDPLWITSDRAVNTAVFERVARQMAIELRVWKLKQRLGIRA